MTDRYESRLDRQIREAQERGEFDNLPGTGKPLPDRGELHDENWWVKELVRREQITGVGPASLRIRREAEDLMQTLATQPFEAQVRRIVTDLNARIELARRGLVDGPPVILTPFDVDDVVTSWRRARRVAD